MKTLQEYRVERNLGLIELAARSGVAIGSITRVERGLPVRLSTLKRIASGLGVSVTEISRAVVARQPQAN